MISNRKFVTRGLAGLAVAASFALAGCGGGGSSAAGEPVTTDTLVGTWEFQEGKGPSGDLKPLDQPIELVVTEDGAFSTSVGCNQMFTQVEVGDAGKITLGPLAMTQMACEEDLMTLEQNFAGALEKVSEGRLDGDKLVLTGDETELSFKATTGSSDQSGE